MALSNLRTGITVRQERATVSPNVQSTTLPVVLVGLNRSLKYQETADIFDWSAGTAATGVEFPGFVSGIVEDGTANPDLTPRFFVSNTLGQAEITDSVTLGNLDSSLGAPSFNIPSGLSAKFIIASGVAGSFTLNTASGVGTDEDDTFRDLTADFVFDQVRAGDAIMVNGIQEYAITGVTQDTELTVRRVGKGPESLGNAEAAKMSLSAENTEDLRTLTTTSAGFIAAGGLGPTGSRVKGGDLLTVDNWTRSTTVAVSPSGLRAKRPCWPRTSVTSTFPPEAPTPPRHTARTHPRPPTLVPCGSYLRTKAWFRPCTPPWTPQDKALTARPRPSQPRPFCLQTTPTTAEASRLTHTQLPPLTVQALAPSRRKTLTGTGSSRSRQARPYRQPVTSTS